MVILFIIKFPIYHLSFSDLPDLRFQLHFESEPVLFVEDQYIILFS